MHEVHTFEDIFGANRLAFAFWRAAPRCVSDQIHICIFSLQKDIVIQCRKRVVTPVLSTIEDRIIRGGGKKWVRKIFETSEKFVGMSGEKVITTD